MKTKVNIITKVEEIIQDMLVNDEELSCEEVYNKLIAEYDEELNTSEDTIREIIEEYLEDYLY